MTSYCCRMPSIFRGTLDVLSLVPGAHLPLIAFRFLPQIPGLSAHRSWHSAWNGVLPSHSAVRHSFPTAPVPRPSGEPTLALRHGTVFCLTFRSTRSGARHRTAFSLTFRSTSSGTSSRNGILPGAFLIFGMLAVLLTPRVQSFLPLMLAEAAVRASHAGSP